MLVVWTEICFVLNILLWLFWAVISIYTEYLFNLINFSQLDTVGTDVDTTKRFSGCGRHNMELFSKYHRFSKYIAIFTGSVSASPGLNTQQGAHVHTARYRSLWWIPYRVEFSYFTPAWNVTGLEAEGGQLIPVLTNVWFGRADYRPDALQGKYGAKKLWGLGRRW